MTATIALELPAATHRAQLVLGACLTLLPSSATVALVADTDGDPALDLAAEVTELCAQFSSARAMPTVELLGRAEARALSPVLRIRAGEDAAADVRAVSQVAVAALAMAQRAHGSSPVGAPTGRAGAPNPAMAEQLAIRDRLVHARDSARTSAQVMIAIVAQVQSTWSAVDAVVRHLQQRDDLTVEVVAVDSDHEDSALPTAAALSERGYRPRDLAWLRDQLADPNSPLACVVFYDPWDGLRPSPATAVAVTNAGVRIAYLPYGTNVGGGPDTQQYAYDLPMHHFASRIYARSFIQQDMFAKYCSAGADHVRVLGVPKFDRPYALAHHPTTQASDAAPPESAAKSSVPAVLWNPHFSVGENGWATVFEFGDQIIEYARTHADMHLIIRPHFRLFRDAALAGGQLAQMAASIRAAAATSANIELDESPDYLASFARADAMVSDLSSLIPEYLITQKPLLYLHRLDGPGVNEDAQYFFEGPVATQWPAIERFLDDVRIRVDVNRPARQLTLARHFPYLDGNASARVAADIAECAKESIS